MARVGDIKYAMRWDDLVLGKWKRDLEEIYVRWLCPRPGWVKLNTDGASKGNPGLAGCGEIIRGHRGEVLEMFAAKCEICSSTQAELWGVVRGLAVAWNAGYRQVQLNVDLLIVVQLVLDTAIPNSPYFHTIQKGRSLLKRNGWE